MLALDGTIGCLEAPASEVLELYRSAPVLTRAAPQARPDALEAFICAIRKRKQVRVYLALIANDRNIFVYTSTSPPADENSYREAFQEALATAKAMGFSPEAVDLSYSPAMREVVLRNMKALRLPGSKPSPLRQGLPGAPQLPRLEPPPAAAAPALTIAPDNAPANPVTDPPEPVPAPPAQPAHDAGRPGEAVLELTAERDRLAAQLQEATAENQRQLLQLQAISAERDEHLARHREIAAELDRLAAQLEEIVAERDDNAARLSGLTAENGDLAERLQQAATERDAAFEALAGARVEIERLTAENGEAEGVREELHCRLAELTALHQKTQEELARVTAGCERVTVENEALIAELATGHAEAERLLPLQQELAELSVRHEESERRCRELCDERSELIGELAAARAQAEKVSEAGAVEAAPIATAGEDARAEAEALRKEKDSTLQHAAVLELEKRNLEEDLHRTRAELRSLREGYLELAAAASAPEESGALPVDAPEPSASEPPEPPEPPEPSDKECLVEPPQAESCEMPDRLLSQMALREKEFAYYAALGEESPDSSAADAVDFPPLADLPPFAPFDGDTREGEPATEQALRLTPLSELQNGFFADADAESTARFALAPGLLTIAYGAPEDVVEMHQSINNANIAPDGTGQESCRGYIFGLKAGETRTVYAVIYGTQSGKTRVYQPERQPWDDTSFSQAVRGAVSFAEEVGLMMEQVHHPSPAKRKEYLQKCPVLSWTGHR